MAEEDQNENVEQAADAVAPEVAEPEAVEPQAAEADEAAVDEVEPAVTEPAPPAAAEPAAPAAAQPAAPARQGPPPEPVEVVPPKERRRRARSAKAAKVPSRPPRTPEERHADRVADRRTKAALRRVERQRTRAKASGVPADTVAQPPAREHAPGVQKTRQGVVVSDRAEKTITVRVDTARRHRRYEKIVRTSRTLHAHDERGDAHVGDTVIVRECRPLSRTKRWRLVEIVERAK